MGIFLSQLPPAEVARLKAELAETLIANFCYPRFFDQRTESLRMRPVDRTKRQEVWLYLNSVDFGSWGRVDLLSPDFQYHIERLIIYFVQRNRSFFGDQGRKRMGDIRTLISSSASSVAEGLRGHLTGHTQSNPPFGSPRPVASWSTTNASNAFEPNWDQIAATTMLLQQQLQEVRGEIKPPSVAEARTAGTAQRTTKRSTGNATRVDRKREVPPPVQSVQPAPPVQSVPPVQPPQPTQPISINKSSPQGEVRATTPADPRSTGSLNPFRTSVPEPTVAQAAAASFAPAPTPTTTMSSAPTAPVPAIPPTHRAGSISSAVPPVEAPIVPPPSRAEVQGKPATAPRSQMSPSERVEPRTAATTIEQPRDLMPTQGAGVPTSQAQNMAVLVSNEDMAIFDQLRHQLIVWLRVEGVHLGIDISNQEPSQLLELLHQQGSFDETRLEIVSTLLDLSNQVSKNRQATLLEYKQALLFYLMHTRRFL